MNNQPKPRWNSPERNQPLFQTASLPLAPGQSDPDECKHEWYVARALVAADGTDFSVRRCRFCPATFQES